MTKIEVMERGKITNERFMIFLILIITPVGGMAIDIFIPSLPAIQAYFQTSESLVKMTIPMFLIGCGAGVAIFGTLSETYGRKKIMVFGLVFYIIFSLLTALSSNITSLLIFRLLGGLAIGAPSSLVRSLLPDCFRGKSFAKATAYCCMAYALSITLSPFLGGYLQYFIGWQGSFLFCTLYAFIVLVFVVIFLPETCLKRTKLKFSIIFDNYKIILSSKKFIGTMLLLTISGSMLVIFNIFAPFIIQINMHYSAVEFGNFTLLIGLGIFTGALLNLILVHKYKPTSLLIFGLFAFLAFSIIFIILNLVFPSQILYFLAPIFFIYFFTRFVFPNTMMLCLEIFPDKAGITAGIMGSTFTILCGITGFVASFLDGKSVLSLGIMFLSFAIIGLFCYFFLCKTRVETENL